MYMYISDHYIYIYIYNDWIYDLSCQLGDLKSAVEFEAK